MSTLTFGLGRSRPVEPSQTRGVPPLTALMERFSAARQARADRFVRPYLARLSDAELEALGFKAGEIAEIRKAPHDLVIGWV